MFNLASFLNNIGLHSLVLKDLIFYQNIVLNLTEVTRKSCCAEKDVVNKFHEKYCYIIILIFNLVFNITMSSRI